MGMEAKAELKLLDLCCGMGGWSIGFYRAGFDCTGVDIVDVGYPYRLVLQDLRKFHTDEKYDVIAASPPCTEFSDLLFLSVSRGQRKPGDPEKGMELVREAKRIIDEVKPRFWVLENVRGSIEHISKLLGPPVVSKRPYYLWGKFPGFLLSQSNLPPKTNKGPRGHPNARLNSETRFNPMASMLRARIPLPLSVPLAKACKEALKEGSR